MKAITIAALVALVASSTITAAPANADNYHNYRGYNNGNHFGWNNNNNGWNNGWNNGYNNNGWRNNSRFGNVDSRQGTISTRIQRGMQTGRLSPAEANRIQDRYNKIANLEARLRVNGLSLSERNRLNSDLSRLSAELNRDMRDRNGSSWW